MCQYDAWRNHNVQGLSLGLSLAFLANAAIWTGYAFIDEFNIYYLVSTNWQLLCYLAASPMRLFAYVCLSDVSSQVSNATGMGSASLQTGVWLYCRYHGQ
jgi:hypothetical protein